MFVQLQNLVYQSPLFSGYTLKRQGPFAKYRNQPRYDNIYFRVLTLKSVIVLFLPFCIYFPRFPSMFLLCYKLLPFSFWIALFFFFLYSFFIHRTALADIHPSPQGIRRRGRIFQFVRIPMHIFTDSFSQAGRGRDNARQARLKNFNRRWQLAGSPTLPVIVGRLSALD